MKKLVALIAVLGFVPYAYGADGADFSHSGDFRIQYQNDMNQDLDDDLPDSPKQNVHQRLRWGTTVRAGEKLTGHFSVNHNANWGSNADSTPDDVAIAGTETANILTVNEAYMAWMASDAIALKVGRGSATIGDGRVVAANDWEFNQTAFDGLMASYDHEMVKTSFFAVQGAKSTTFNTFGRFYGVSFDLKSLPSFLKMVNLHYIQILRDRGAYTIGGTAVAALSKEDSTRMGVTLAGDTAGVDYRLTYASYKGEREVSEAAKKDVDASMIDAEVGYSMPETMNLRVSLGYHTDSGTKSAETDQDGDTNDDETYQGFHYDRHHNAGYMDVLAFGNLTYTRAGVSLNATDDVMVGLDYYIFTQTEKSDFSYSATGKFDSDGAGAANRLAGTDATKDDLGTEIDLVVTKKYSNNFLIKARYGIFSPGDEFKAAGGEDDYSQLYLESKLTF